MALMAFAIRHEAEGREVSLCFHQRLAIRPLHAAVESSPAKLASEYLAPLHREIVDAL